MKWDRIREHYSAFWLAAGTGLVLPLWTTRRRGDTLRLWPLAACSILSIVPGYRFFGHYWIQLLPAVALLIAASADSARSMLTRWMRPVSAGTLVVGAFGVVVLHNLYAQREYYFFPNYTRVLRDVYGANPFPEMMVVGQYIKERTSESDQIVVLGSEPELYFYTGRRAPTRHHYLAYLMTDGRRFPRNRAMQQEFVENVTAALPKYMVFVAVPVSWLGNADSDRTILSWFDRFAAEHYRLVGLADMITPSETRYVWDDAVARYQRRGQYYILVYERA